MMLRALLLVPLLIALTAHAQEGAGSAGGTERPGAPTIDSDNRSVGTSVAQGFVRSCGVLRRSALSPTVRPFESLAHLAPRAREHLYAVSAGRGSADIAYVIDGVAELPEWTRAYPPIVRPSGEPQWLHLRLEERR